MVKDTTSILDQKMEKGKAPTRTFQMTTKEARYDDEVILGTFLVIDFLAMVLYDAGASRSLGSPTFCAQFVIPHSPWSHMLDIEVVVGSYVLVRENLMGARSLSLVTPFLLL